MTNKDTVDFDEAIIYGDEILEPYLCEMHTQSVFFFFDKTLKNGLESEEETKNIQYIP